MINFEQFLNESKDEQKFTSAMKKAFLKDLDPVIKSYELEVKEVAFYPAIPANNNEARPGIVVKEYNSLNGSWVAGSFFTESQAKEFADFMEKNSTSIVTMDPPGKYSRPSTSVSEDHSGTFLDMRYLRNMAMRRNISIDFSKLRDKYQFFSFNPNLFKFWKDGMDLEQFKKEHVGAISLKKFGI